MILCNKWLEVGSKTNETLVEIDGCLTDWLFQTHQTTVTIGIGILSVTGWHMDGKDLCKIFMNSLGHKLD